MVGFTVELWPWLIEVRIQKVGQAHTAVQPSLPSSSSCIPFCFERIAKGGKEGGGDGTTQSREGETRPLPHAIMSAGVKAPVYTSVVHRKVQHHAWQGWCISTHGSRQAGPWSIMPILAVVVNLCVFCQNEQTTCLPSTPEQTVPPLNNRLANGRIWAWRGTLCPWFRGYEGGGGR